MDDADPAAPENAIEQPQPEPTPLSLDEIIAQAKAKGEAVAQEFTIRKARKAIHRILEASDEQVRDRPFILSCIEQVGITYQNWPGLAPFTDCINSVPYGIIQIPTEFADYLLLAGATRPATVIEIGVFRGASAYQAAAYFFRLNRELTYTAVDVVDALVDFDYFRTVLPIRKAVPSTSGDFTGQRFDLTFIDGDHSYDGSRVDWLNVGRSSELVAFHDINGAEYDGENGGVRRTWNELNLERRHSRSILEISHHPGWMGIGMIFNKAAPWL